MIKNLVFDMGGVLVDLHPRRCVSAFSRLGFPEMASLVDSWHPRGIFEQLELGLITGEQFCDYVRAQSGRNTSSAEIHAACVSFIDPIPDYKLDLLAELRRRYRVLLLSNTNEIVYPYIDAHSLCRRGGSSADYFEKVYLSYAMHDMKPSPTIFEKMIADSGIIPQETRFIDDAERNVAIGRELGFETYRPAPKEDLRQVLAPFLGN